MTRRRLALLLSVLALAGCRTPSTDELPAPPAGKRADAGGAFASTDPWLLTTRDPNAARGNHGIFLGNGRVGITLGAFGPDKNSVAYVAGVYDRSQNLRPLPVFKDVAPPNAPFYEQSLDLRRGILTTRFGADEKSASTLTAFVLRDDPELVVLAAKGKDAVSRLDAQISGDAVSGDPQIAVHAARHGGDDFRLVVLAFVRAKDGAAASAQIQRAEMTANVGVDPLIRRQEAAWSALWSADIQIDGDPEAQQLVHKAMFDLLQSARDGSADSIPPESLSGDFYKGHIFWDADVWMFPALLAQHPEIARSLLAYRVARLPQARAQAKSKGFSGADFPWESADKGDETAPGGFSEGRHVTAGVGWAAWQYWLATGDKAWLKSDGFPLLSGVADYFASRATKSGAGYSIGPVTGPDELHMKVTDNAYTNALARQVLLGATAAAREIGQPAHPKWATVAAGLTVPFDKSRGVFLKGAGDDGKQTKQADGELLLWPAQHPMDAKTAAATFDFHKARPIKNGPAMTTSIHALIAARLGRADEAEAAFRESYRPFVRGPFLLFSEKRSLDRCVFTTGLGGVLQSVVYGFGGLDFAHFDAPAGAFQPALPKAWTKLTLSGVRYRGKKVTVTVTPQGRTVTAGS